MDGQGEGDAAGPWNLRFGLAVEAWGVPVDGDFRALLRALGEIDSVMMSGLGAKAYSARFSLPLKLGGSAGRMPELSDSSFLTSHLSTLSSMSGDVWNISQIKPGLSC